MVGRGKIIPILIGAASLCAAVRADMVSLSPADTECVSSQQTRRTADSPFASSSAPCFSLADIADFSLLPLGSLPELNVETGQGSVAQSPQIVTDKQNSVSLCLYALLGLGLCRSAPLVKRLHFGGIPDWYHGSGPCQIGHSFAVAPDCRWSVTLPCFAPPGHAPKDISAWRCAGTLISFLKGPQIPVWELGSRGPP